MRAPALAILTIACSATGGDSSTGPDARTDTTTTAEVATDTLVADGAATDTGTTGGGDAIFTTEDIGTCSDCIDISVAVPDCGSVTCPSEFPHPVGCSLMMGGSDSRGCVAHTPGSSTVAFKVGTTCGAGIKTTGIVRCGKLSGGPLNAMNCPFNKSSKIYAMTLGGCPG